MPKNLLKAIRLSSITLSLLPGIVEAGVFTVFALAVLLLPLPEWLPRPVAIRWLGVTGLLVMLLVIAIRQRLDPLMGRLFRAGAIVFSAVFVQVVLDPDFRSTRSIAVSDGSDRGVATLHNLLSLCAVVGVGLMLTAFPCGLRKRQQAVPGLVKLLTSGGKHARRKAIYVVATLEGLDRAAAKAFREDGVALLRWLYRNETPALTPDAVPALQRALQDDDLFVRTQAAKVLTRMGVTFGEEERKLVE